MATEPDIEKKTQTVSFEKDPSTWYKSRSKRMIFGVLGGYSDKTGINVSLLRIIFIIPTLVFNLLPISLLAYLYLAVTRPEDPLFISKKNKVTKLIEDTPGHDGAVLALDRVGFVNTYYFLTFGLASFVAYGLLFETEESSGDPLIIFVMISGAIPTIFSPSRTVIKHSFLLLPNTSHQLLSHS